MTVTDTTMVQDLQNRFGLTNIVTQATQDAVATVWTQRETIRQLLRYLKTEVAQPYRMLYDLTAIDERMRTHQGPREARDFTVVYHLLSFDRNEYLRIKVPLDTDDLQLETISDLWPATNWYEREVWDMFGIVFEGHPHLARLLMPATWQGHPLRKDHPARATEIGPFTLPDEKQDKEQEALRFRPEDWGMKRGSEDSDFLFLNVGPQAPRDARRTAHRPATGR